MSTITNPQAPEDLISGLNEYVKRSVERNGGSTVASKPAHRIKFHWPPHPISYSFHVLASDWTGRTTLDVDGQTFQVHLARTPNGVFGKIPELWHEDRGENESEMIANLRKSLKPLFERQKLICETLEQKGRFTEHIRDLGPLSLLKLLYCKDRDVANDARAEIETRASTGIFFHPLVWILEDTRHPQRRSAQWCVLDLFEDLPSFACEPTCPEIAIRSIKGLIWSAEDDYARTVFKAGVVLGGHTNHPAAGAALIDCLRAPSRIGRRAAIHGVFHVAEWMPESKEAVLNGLKKVAESDPEQLLREYALCMARDIETGDTDHISDVIFPDEP